MFKLLVLFAVASAMRPFTAYILMADIFWSSSLRHEIVTTISKNECNIAEMPVPRFKKIIVNYDEMYTK